MSVGASRSVLNDLVRCSESHLWLLVVLGFDVHVVDCRLVVRLVLVLDRMPRVDHAEVKDLP